MSFFTTLEVIRTQVVSKTFRDLAVKMVKKTVISIKIHQISFLCRPPCRTPPFSTRWCYTRRFKINEIWLKSEDQCEKAASCIWKLAPHLQSIYFEGSSALLLNRLAQHNTTPQVAHVEANSLAQRMTLTNCHHVTRCADVER